MSECFFKEKLRETVAQSSELYLSSSMCGDQLSKRLARETYDLANQQIAAEYNTLVRNAVKDIQGFTQELSDLKCRMDSELSGAGIRLQGRTLLRQFDEKIAETEKSCREYLDTVEKEYPCDENAPCAGYFLDHYEKVRIWKHLGEVFYPDGSDTVDEFEIDALTSFARDSLIADLEEFITPLLKENILYMRNHIRENQSSEMNLFYTDIAGELKTLSKELGRYPGKESVTTMIDNVTNIIETTLLDGAGIQ